jgi:hypothetical protein
VYKFQSYWTVAEGMGAQYLHKKEMWLRGWGAQYLHEKEMWLRGRGTQYLHEKEMWLRGWGLSTYIKRRCTDDNTTTNQISLTYH